MVLGEHNHNRQRGGQEGRVWDFYFIPGLFLFNVASFDAVTIGMINGNLRDLSPVALYIGVGMVNIAAMSVYGILTRPRRIRP